MSRHRLTLLVLLIVLIAGLIAAVGIMAFQLGQQSAAGTTADSLGSGRTSSIVASPGATRRATSLPVVTNTPTSSPTPTATAGPTLTPTPTPTLTPSPTPTPIVVITHIAPLGRLETTEFTMRTVVDLENEPTNLWQNIFGTDKLTLLAEGEVVAGVDLNKVKSEDIMTDGTTVKIRLPAPEILYSRIDNERTVIYERKTGLFRQIDKTLESRARLLAEQALIDWAIQRHIYEKAEESSRVYIENLLHSLGFTDITIEFKSEPSL